MNISSFDDLLRAARAQPEPQRLLFVFAQAELPEGSSAQQCAGFEAGEGGALAPLMAVDKTPDEIASFDALVQESRQFGPEWAVVFVTSLAGRDGRAPTDKDAEEVLQRMVESVKAGLFGSFVPFDANGDTVAFG